MAFPRVNHISVSAASEQEGNLFNPAVPGSWVTFPQRSHEPKGNHPCLFPCGPKEFAPRPCAGAVNPFNPLICFFLPFVIPASCTSRRAPGIASIHHPWHFCLSSPGTHHHHTLRLSFGPQTLSSPSLSVVRVLTKSSNHRGGGQHKAGVGRMGIIQPKTEGDGPQPSLTQCHKIRSAVLLYGDLSTKGDPWVSLECSCVLLVLLLHCACCREHDE